LFPVLERIQTDAENMCEFGLAEPELGANRDDTARVYAIDASNGAFVAP